MKLNWKAVGIGAVVRMTRKVALPIRSDEAERVPALRCPTVGGGLLLEDEMADAALLEVVAD